MDYTANGQEGWQYQNFYQTMIITLRNKSSISSTAASDRTPGREL